MLSVQLSLSLLFAFVDWFAQLCFQHIEPKMVALIGAWLHILLVPYQTVAIGKCILDVDAYLMFLTENNKQFFLNTPEHSTLYSGYIYILNAVVNSAPRMRNTYIRTQWSVEVAYSRLKIKLLSLTSITLYGTNQHLSDVCPFFE